MLLSLLRFFIHDICGEVNESVRYSVEALNYIITETIHRMVKVHNELISKSFVLSVVIATQLCIYTPTSQYQMAKLTPLELQS